MQISLEESVERKETVYVEERRLETTYVLGERRWENVCVGKERERKEHSKVHAQKEKGEVGKRNERLEIACVKGREDKKKKRKESKNTCFGGEGDEMKRKSACVDREEREWKLDRLCMGGKEMGGCIYRRRELDMCQNSLKARVSHDFLLFVWKEWAVWLSKGPRKG